MNFFRKKKIINFFPFLRTRNMLPSFYFAPLLCQPSRHKQQPLSCKQGGQRPATCFTSFAMSRKEVRSLWLVSRVNTKQNFGNKKLNRLHYSNHFDIKLFAVDHNKEEFIKSTIISNTLPSLHSLNTFSFWSGQKTMTKNLNKNQENYVKNNNEVNKANVMNFYNSKQKTKFYTSYSKLSEIKLLTIGIASPLRILQWAEKTLPNGKIYGEVLNANTLHHKTFKPQKAGLFCERIFGPLKDFECACGKINKSNKQSQTMSLILNNTQEVAKQSQILNENKIEKKIIKNLNRKFCPDCDVEYTWSVIRRYQLGYIKLCSPVTHIWFLKGTPSYLSLLLDMKKRYLQFVTYCSEILTIEKSSMPLYPVNSFYNSNIDYNSSIPSYVRNTNLVNETNFGWNSVVNKINLSKTTLQNSLTKRTLLDLKEKKDYHEHNSSDLSKLIILLNEKNEKLKNIKSNKVAYFLLNKKSTTNKQLLFPTQNQQIIQNSFSIWRNIPVFLQNNKNQIKEGTAIISILLLNLYIKNFHLKDISGNNVSHFNFDKKISWQKNKKQETLALWQSKSARGTMVHEAFFEVSKTCFLERAKQKPIIKNADNVNKFFRKLPNIKNILKKLPLDLYIICLLEPTLHKSALTLAIKNTWEYLYKQAFIKSIFKAKNIFNKYLFTLKKNKNKNLIHNYFITSSNNIRSGTYFRAATCFAGEAKAEAPVTKRLLITQQNVWLTKQKQKLNFLKFILFIQSQQIEDLVKNNQQNDIRLKHLKKQYINHLFKLFENIPYEITSLNYTTSFLQKNDYSSIKKKISLDIRNILLKKTTFIQKFLIKNFLNSFILDFYYIFMFKMFKNTKLYSILNTRKNVNPRINAVLNTYKNYLTFSNVINNQEKTKKMSEASRWSIQKNTIEIHKELKTTKCLYNNIYTISHRERWAIEKDWQIFTLFAFGPTNYFDYRISTYKNRLVSLKNEEISSFKFPFSIDSSIVSSSSLANIESITKNVNSFKNYQTTLTPSLSNSFFSGAGIIQQLLNEFDFYEIKKLDKQNRLILYQLNKSILKLKKQVQIFVYDKNAQIELRELCKKRDLLIRRTKLVRKLFRKNSNPTSMILNLIPVLPPDLRPIVKMGNQIAASDLNRLYQRVIYRNDRLKKFLKDAATSQSYEMKYAQRLLQEAVDNLLQNGKSGSNSEKDSRGRALKSLSDVLKGKQGRFRQFLLGKRVDYSGRSVIVVGPKLKLHECGLPLEMAKELYLPFLLKSLLNKNYAKTVVGAKTLIKNNSSLAHELLREIMQVSPVLLNRAPTLHRLGFQAFVPKLIEGRAILLHPLVCSAFNADFDGDQMAVHVPITIEARAEAWKLMLSKNNLLSTATGDPLAIPSQDMVLGCYYLTTFSNNGKILKDGSRAATVKASMFFNSLQDVIKLYEQRIINIHSLIWVKWINLIENSNEQENNQSFEIRLSSFGQWQEITSNSYRIYDSYNNLINQYILTTPGRILFNSLIQKIIIS